MAYPTESETNLLSFLTGTNGAYLEALFEKFLTDPDSVEPSLKDYFLSLKETNSYRPQGLLSRDSQSTSSEERPIAFKTAALEAQSMSSLPDDLSPLISDSYQAFKLIQAYQHHGHLMAKLDPLGLAPPTLLPELDPASYSFHQESVYVQGFLGHSWIKISDLIETLRTLYCGSVGFEFMHIQDETVKSWFQHAIEQGPPPLKTEDKKELFTFLSCAELFEKFLGLKFPGAKRFGLEGEESFIPLMKKILALSAAKGLKEAIIGMAHRGRLNVLANVIGKPLQAIIAEFQDKTSEDILHGSGDVKYHQGASYEQEIEGKTVHLSLTANPSHLEAINPVVVGKVRAKQHLYQDPQGDGVMGILVHGDAAFAGQGVVAETLLLSNLPGYSTQGTLHIIINNQIGFTTSPSFGRSSPYSSDVAKVIQAPIIHVNGDDPEAVIWAAHLATHYRYHFKKDIVIDLVCYRRHGHNEMDEPAFTQPLMYTAIRNHTTTRDLYGEYLQRTGVLTSKDIDFITTTLQENFQKAFEEAATPPAKQGDWLQKAWTGKSFDIKLLEKETGVENTTLKNIGSVLTHIPDGFIVNSKIERLLAQKQQMFETGKGFDWATAEACAFGSLIHEGYTIRLSGQDSGRGTFSQRHAVWVHQETGQTYSPLNNIQERQGNFNVIDSPLAEASVLGFELGYSLADPDTLVLWEAQFGDFANGAQVIIDQFISSQEAKWLRLSGLVLLLPHGYEGQGPEHSSARLERYLQLCAENNMIVANCTTPANYFHILRRQLVTPVRKPLVIMTPKSLLRDKQAVSDLKDMGPGTAFQKVIAEKVKDPRHIRRVIMCSGKIAYDLLQAKEEAKRQDILIVRLEQLYPFPYEALADVLRPYSEATFTWCQEEPKNMGSWSFIDRRLEKTLIYIGAKSMRPLYAGRPEAAATATGFHGKHQHEHQQLIKEAMA